MRRYGLFILRGLLKVSQTENKSEEFQTLLFSNRLQIYLTTVDIRGSAVV